MDKQRPAYWAFGVQGAIENVVRANYPHDVRQWPLLKLFNADAYRVDSGHFVLVMRDKLSGIPVIPAEMKPFPYRDHPQLPLSHDNVEAWQSFLYSAFQLRNEDLALILPDHDSGKEDAAADYALFDSKEKTLWERQIAFAVERQQRLFQHQRQPITNVTYNVAGPNARVNINSTDNSVNVVNEASPEVFDKLLAAIKEARADAAATERLSAALEELKRARGTPSLGARYRDFMSVLADHIQVFGPIVAPYLPLLAALVIHP